MADFRGKAEVVLFFYPKDNTPVCTAEACAFRDGFEGFRELGAEVIGISSDSEESHRKFASKHRLPYRLVSDAGGAIRKRYGVPKILGLFPGRATYVIDREGIIRLAFVAPFQSAMHVEEALRALREIRERA